MFVTNNKAINEQNNIVTIKANIFNILFILSLFLNNLTNIKYPNTPNIVPDVLVMTSVMSVAPKPNINWLISNTKLNINPYKITFLLFLFKYALISPNNKLLLLNEIWLHMDNKMV